MDVLIIYQYCTFGGVERLILNRALALKKHGFNFVIHAGYLSDSGALKSFNHYILKNNLQNNVIPFLIPNNLHFTKTDFDMVFVIDSPQVLDALSIFKNVFIECHTPYIENRQYLKDIPDWVKGVIVPSEAFRNIIFEEFPNIHTIIVLPNPVPDEFHHLSNEHTALTKKPITYLARLDSLKNIDEAIRVFNLLKQRNDVMQIIIGEGSTDGNMISILKKFDLLKNTILRDRIIFEQVPRLINMVKNAKGIFLSPSKGESFGLSAAEFISGGVPVMLSKIPAHSALVADNNYFLYDQGDFGSAANKIEYLLDNWDSMSKSIEEYGEKFNEKFFINAWSNLIKSYEN